MAPHQIEIQASPLQAGFAGSTPFVATNNNGLTFVANLTNPFPSSATASPGASLGLLTSTRIDVGCSTAPILSFGRKTQKLARWTSGIQRELPGHCVLEANYVSAWGYDLGVARQPALLP